MAAAVPLPAAARVVAHVDTLNGVPVPDPYRWLEDTLATGAHEWVAQQERYAGAVLARVVGRDSLTRQFERVFRDAPTLDRVVETSRGLVLTRYLGDAPSLQVAAADGSGERTLRSATELGSSDGGIALRAVVPSWEGRLIALGTTARGDAGPAIVVLDAQSGAVLADRIPDLLTSTSGTRYEVQWLPANRAGAEAFVYPRLWPGAADGPAAGRLARARQFVHRIGMPQASDVAVFGYGVSAAVPIEPEDLATRVLAVPGSRWMVGTVFRSRRNGNDHFAARRTPGDSTVPNWVPLLALEDLAAFPRLRGDTAYALVRRDADRGRIARRVLGDGPAPAGAWETIVPERRGVITAFAVQDDALYFTEREGGALSLHVLPYGATVTHPVSLPVTGTVRISPRSPVLPGVLISVESWAMPPRWYRVTAAGAVVEAVTIDDGGKLASSPTLVSERLEARSRDGTLVPVSLVYDRAALRSGRLDGTAPLVVEAYGGFGVATDPGYDPTIQIWTSLGGVYAYAHVRGGGELGSAWHEAATREHKQRSVDDVIGAVEALISHGYTSAGRVALQGISFGAVIAGLAPLQRPELFGAVIYDVGGPDEVRAAAVDPSAARNIAEIGDVDSPEGIRMLMKVSPYHLVPSKISLPAMLVHSATDDYNFGTEMLVAKFVARMQAANTSERPLLWVRTGGGHRWLRYLTPDWGAKVTSFLLWQTGDPRYQP
ncbi:MAG: prolyl oligopeptidase family serine peptidase [Gemmatimonadota bacterium]